MDHQDAPAIEVSALRKVYPGEDGPPKEALKSVDLTVPRGAIFGLLGPNGAGKSTLINILAALVVKTSGSARILGWDIERDMRRARGSIGVVPQELNLDSFFSPREVMDLQAGLYGVPKRQRRTMEILEALGLEDKADIYARSLSGGMRRRLLVAKALAAIDGRPCVGLEDSVPGHHLTLRFREGFCVCGALRVCRVGTLPSPQKISTIAIERFVQAQKNQRVNTETLVIDTSRPIVAAWRRPQPKKWRPSQIRQVPLRFAPHTNPTDRG